MKNWCYVILPMVVVYGCSNPKAKLPLADSTKKVSNIDPKFSLFKPYKLNDNYIVIDTGRYGNDGPMGGGKYAIIESKKNNVDTIELCFGLKNIGKNIYIYHSLVNGAAAGENVSKSFLTLDVNNYIIINDGNKTPFKNLTVDFDDYFSSPEVIDHKIYFWQLKQIDSIAGNYNISAAEYDPETKKTNSHFLTNDDIGTDDEGYFPLPYKENNCIVFDMQGKKKWKFLKNFK